jgi:hypothetical protein
MRWLNMDWGGPNILIQRFGGLKEGYFFAQEVVLFYVGRFA